MALQRRLILKQALDRGFGTSTIPADAGGYLVGDKIGIHSFLGLAYVSVEDFPGSTVADKAALAVAQLPTTGGILDLRSMPGAQRINSDFLAGVTKPVVVLLAAGTYTMTAGLTVPSNCSIIGTSWNSTIIQASGSVTRMLDGREKSGILLQDFKVDGNATGVNGIDLSNSTVGGNTLNRVYDIKIDNTTTIGLNMDNNGASELYNAVFDVDSGTSLQFRHSGGEIVLDHVKATNAADTTVLYGQTITLRDCQFRRIQITENTEMFRDIGGYHYAVTGNACINIASGKWVGVMHLIGTRLEISDPNLVSIDGNAAIDGKVVTAVICDGVVFNNARDGAAKDVFGSTFGANSGSIPLIMHGGNVQTGISNVPSWNPPGSVMPIYEGFVSASGVTLNYRHIGTVGNNGGAGLLATPPSTSTIPIIARGLAAQSGDLQQWQNTGGSVLAQISSAGSITSAGYIVSSSSSLGVGYAAGAGGTVTQSTSKSTSVTLNKVTGTITMNNATLNSATSVGFTLANTTIAATDVVLVSIKSGATADSYAVTVDATTAGSCRISLRNVSGGNLGEAVVLSFVVIKGVAA